MNITTLSEQNEVIISLLGRLAYPEEELKKIVTKKKQNPNAYIKAYNACDGSKGVTEIAKIAGVAQPTMTPILQYWKKLGIVYQVGKNYVKLYTLTEEKEVNKNGIKPGEVNGENNQENGFDNSTHVEESREPEPKQDNSQGSGFGTL